MHKVNGTGRLPRARWAIVLASALLALIWLAMLVGGTGPLDRRLYEAIYVGQNPALVRVARFLTFFGGPVMLIAGGSLFLLVMWRRGYLRTGLTLVAVTMIGWTVNELQKYEVARARPLLEPHLVLVQSPSFPSGHATSSMIFYLTLALVLTGRGKWRRLAVAGAILLSLLIGTSRVMLGVHWPSDVVGGWVFGLLWVLVTLRIAKHLLRPSVRVNSSNARNAL